VGGGYQSSDKQNKGKIIMGLLKSDSQTEEGGDQRRALPEQKAKCIGGEGPVLGKKDRASRRRRTRALE